MERPMSGADEAMTARRARELLGVGAKATPAELRRAFRVAAKTCLLYTSPSPRDS